MAHSRKNFGSRLAAVGTGTGIGLYTCIQAGGSSGDLTLVPGVAQGGDLRLALGIVTTATDASCADTGFGTGGSNSLIDDQVMAQGIQNLSLGFAAGSTGVRPQTSGQTGGLRGNLTGIPSMTGSGDNYLGNQDFAADRAVLALSQAASGTGCCNSSIDDLGVPQGSNDFLSNQNLAADRAVLAFSQTSCSTGRSHGSVDGLGVAQSGNDFLSNQNLAADRAVLAFGQTSCSTGRSHGSVDGFGVAQSGNDFLGNQDFATDRAVLAFGQTGGSTGRSHSSVDGLGVAQSGNDFLSNQDFAAGRAVLAFSQTSGSTGSCNSSVDNLSMTQSHSKDFTANSTGLRSGTGCSGTGSMALSGDLFDTAQSFITDGALGTFGMTSLGTGGSLRCNISGSMAQSGNNFLRNQDFVTDRAVLALGQTGFGTGGRNRCIHSLSVTGCRNHFGVAVTTVDGILTGEGLQAVGGTGSRSGDGLIVGMVTFLDPDTIGVGICTAGIGGHHMSAVSIFQLGRSQRNLGISGVRGISSLDHLIGNRLSTRLQLHDRPLNTSYRCTTSGGVSIAGRCINRTFNHNGGIHQISLGTGIGSSGCVSNRDESLVTRTCIAAPFIGVIHVNVDAGAKGADRVFTNNDLRTWQHCNVLIDGDIAAVGADSQVAVNRQLIILGIDGAGANGHIDRRDSHVAVGFDDQAVRCTIITLGHVT